MVNDVAAAREAWKLMGQIFGDLRPRMLEAAGELGLTLPQLFALRALEPGRPMPMRALAAHLRCDSSNVTGLIDGLESRGLVERRPSDEDRRVRMLAVTEDGERVRARVAELMGAVPPPLASLSAADQRTLRDILRRALG